MQGIANDPELQGIIPRAFTHIFDHISQTKEKKFLVRASFLEIYNEDIRDLLVKQKGKEKGLELKEHPETGVYIKNLSNFVVKNVKEMEQLMETGNKYRSVGATLMNETSSRSHSIFTITIESSELKEDGEEHIVQGKLNLVDLAGSERQSKTGATGDRLKEATKINFSLSALGNCISALVDGRSSHIPYRDSKLTRLLQDSLGGNAKTLMIATLSPAIYNFEESLSTLRYANRAKCIKNKPKINEDPKDAMLREYQEEILKLKAALQAKQLGEAQIVTKVLKKYVTKKIQKVIPKKVVARAAGGVSTPAEDEESDHSINIQQLSFDDLQKQLQEEKKLLLESNDILAEEKMKIARELEAKSVEVEKEKQEYEKMDAQLRAIESQLLVGGTSIIDRIKKQENEIAKAQLELQEKAIRERQLKEQLELKLEQQIQMEEHYASLQEEVDSKTKKLKKLLSKLEDVRDETNDLQDEFRNERDDLLDTIRLLNREIAFKDLVIDNFIPVQEKQKMAARATFDQDTDEWNLLKFSEIKSPAELIKRPIMNPKFKRPVCAFARKSMMTLEAPIRYLPDNLLRLSVIFLFKI
jgi:kinesin family protein 3/17